VTLLDDVHSEELPTVKPAFAVDVASNVEECLPKTEIRTVPETGELVIRADDKMGFTNDNAPENITLDERPVVTKMAEVVPDPAEVRHLIDDSENHSEN